MNRQSWLRTCLVCLLIMGWNTELAAQNGTESPGAANIRIHKVKPGDTLSRIARSAYGDARLWTLIRNLNRSVDYRNLRPGTQLRMYTKSWLIKHYVPGLLDKASKDLTTAISHGILRQAPKRFALAERNIRSVRALLGAGKLYQALVTTRKRVSPECKKLLQTAARELRDHEAVVSWAREAKVRPIKGPLTEAVRGEKLAENEGILVPSSGMAGLNLLDGARCRIYPGTTLRMQAMTGDNVIADSTAWFTLDTGSLLLNLADTPLVPARRIHTALGDVYLLAGAVRVTSNKRSCAVSLLRGTCLVVVEGRQTALKSGQGAVIHAGVPEVSVLALPASPRAVKTGGLVISTKPAPWKTPIRFTADSKRIEIKSSSDPNHEIITRYQVIKDKSGVSLDVQPGDNWFHLSAVSPVGLVSRPTTPAHLGFLPITVVHSKDPRDTPQGFSARGPVELAMKVKMPSAWKIHRQVGSGSRRPFKVPLILIDPGLYKLVVSLDRDGKTLTAKPLEVLVTKIVRMEFKRRGMLHYSKFDAWVRLIDGRGLPATGERPLFRIHPEGEMTFKEVKPGKYRAQGVLSEPQLRHKMILYEKTRRWEFNLDLSEYLNPDSTRMSGAGPFLGFDLDLNALEVIPDFAGMRLIGVELRSFTNPLFFSFTMAGSLDRFEELVGGTAEDMRALDVRARIGYTLISGIGFDAIIGLGAVRRRLFVEDQDDVTDTDNTLFGRIEMAWFPARLAFELSIRFGTTRYRDMDISHIRGSLGYLFRLAR